MAAITRSPNGIDLLPIIGISALFSFLSTSQASTVAGEGDSGEEAIGGIAASESLTSPATNKEHRGNSVGAGTRDSPTAGSYIAITTGVFVAAAIYAAVLAACTVWALRSQARGREERSQLGGLLAAHAWPYEGQTGSAVSIIRRLGATEIFRGVTGYHVLAYKYRFEENTMWIENGTRRVGEVGEVYSIRSRLKRLASTTSTTSTSGRSGEGIDVFASLKKIERLFDALSLALPCEGRCPRHVRVGVGETLASLAQSTSCLWSDQRASVIRRIVRHFSGRRSAQAFDAGLISDVRLRAMIGPKIPYIDFLVLYGDRFVLRDTELLLLPVVPDQPRIDLRWKVRYIDMILSRDARTMTNLVNVESLVESYRMARDLSFTYRLVQSRSHHPDISVSSDTPVAAVLGECVMQLRHLLRLICTSSNIRMIEADDNFFQFIVRLHESLYGWSDEEAVMEAVDRARLNIAARLNGITVEQVLANREFTKTLLEQIEKDLYTHLHYLTTQQVDEKRKGKQRLAFAEPHTKYKGERERFGEGTSSRDQGLGYGKQTHDTGGRMSSQIVTDTSASDVSVYTSAVALQVEPITKGRGGKSIPGSGEELYSMAGVGGWQQRGGVNDESSIVSGKSSLYATVTSLSSERESPSVSSRGGETVRRTGTKSDAEEEFLESPV